MPTRIIRDGILTSERINALSPHAELFYRRLMSVADDHGRFSGNLTLIRSSCYPLKVDSAKEDSIKKHLAECVDAGLIVPYTVDSKPFILLLDFGQRINGKSKYPEPPSSIHRESPGIPGNPRLGGGGGEGVLVTPKGVTRPNSSDPPQPSTSNCPAQRIVDLYHEKLPELPRCEKLTTTRRGYLQQRWREDLETLDDWAAFFADVRKSDFLMGKKPGRDGRPPFRADLEWLTKPANYAKFIEGKYTRAV